MARSKTRGSEADTAFDAPGKVVVPVPLQDEVTDSFLEYSYSVIHSRALPDARDGLKPVHRRILFGMNDTGLRPDHAHVKSARVVGDVMGRYHPHGDSAIYDALVRLAQDFSVTTPLIDGHGNFGSPNDPPAAMRYTECRMSGAAMLMVGELGEATVDMVPNYDGSLLEPSVLPAAYPYLLVNGTTGIAVGMATNMIPHNLAEVIAAARLVNGKPKATLDELMALVPGPDLPTGGTLIGLDQVRAAYESGRGTVRIRATAVAGPLEGSRGRQAITVTELPYGVGSEKVIEAVKAEIGKKRLSGVADIKDLSDRKHGTRLVIECKTGVNPEALLAELYRFTPLEVSFGITNLALVDGQPRVLGLKELLEVFLAHRCDVVTRRTTFRLEKAQARLHIVDGLLVALDNVDEVVRIIRGSKDTSEAHVALIKRFDFSDVQAGHILDMPLRRLVALEVESLRSEKHTLEATIEELQRILGSERVLKGIVDKELAAVARDHGRERRTLLVDGDLKEVLAASVPSVPLEVTDEPCRVLLSATGLLARVSVDPMEGKGKLTRARHDVLLGSCPASTRGQVVAVTSTGRAFKVEVVSLPALPDVPGSLSLRGGIPGKELMPLRAGESVVAIAPVGAPASGSPGLVLGTRAGVVKVVSPDWPVRGDEFDVIGLKPGDAVVSGSWLGKDEEELVFVASDGSLLRFPSSAVRPQGRSGSGIAGMRLASGAHVVGFSAVADTDSAFVVTATEMTAKVTPLGEYPRKGRGTGGVRAHRFLKGEDRLVVAFAGVSPGAATGRGEPVALPEPSMKRDGSGVASDPVGVLGGLQVR